jgi:hypothetical protein
LGGSIAFEPVRVEQARKWGVDRGIEMFRGEGMEGEMGGIGRHVSMVVSMGGEFGDDGCCSRLLLQIRLHIIMVTDK